MPPRCGGGELLWWYGILNVDGVLFLALELENAPALFCTLVGFNFLDFLFAFFSCELSKLTSNNYIAELQQSFYKVVVLSRFFWVLLYFYWTVNVPVHFVCVHSRCVIFVKT